MDKTNYGPVSVLLTIWKFFQKVVAKQLNHYIQNHLSPHLCGSRKGYNTEQALLALIESWKKSLDMKGFGEAILMDLSKAFDTLNHELLISKLHAYGFDESSLKLLHSYLSNRWDRS